MKNLYLLILLLIFGFSGCKKTISNPEVIPNGTYFGTFQRNLISGKGQKANIRITFSSGKWNGQSDIANYPALCHGTYKTEGNKVIIENECAFTANFDWSLILSGEYKLQTEGDTLTITKSVENPAIESYSDVYSLSVPKTGIKKSPIDGTWIEITKKSDIIIFSPEFDGQFPIFNLERKKRFAGGHKLLGYSSGSYHYILGENSISVNSFLSSNSAYNRFYFKMMPGENEFRIGNFFANFPPYFNTDTLTFTKIK